MNCIEHNDRNAVSTCAKCGAGLCNDCITGSVFRNDNNQPFCKKCNYEIACENDRIFKSTLRSKQIIMCIYLAAVVIGVVFFVIKIITGNGNFNYAALIMLLIWACGSIANLFDRTSMIRRLLGNIGNGLGRAIESHSIPMFIMSIVGLTLGTAISIFIMGIASPIFIIAYLIGIHKVKKQIAENNEVLSRFHAENNQN